jgi:hypothetical protein
LFTQQVAKGYSQQEGIDYNDTFAPVVRLENMRLLIAYATQHNLEIDQMDIDSAFLQATLQDEIYVAQPQGFVSTTHPHYVCKLNKSLYGLKQAPLEWNKTLNNFLLQNGFNSIDADSCIYIKHEKEETTVLSIYVDDILIIGKRSNVDQVKIMIKEKFKCKDLGPVKSILGIEVLRNRKESTTLLLQRGYIEKVLSKFKLKDCKPKPTPMTPGSQQILTEIQDHSESSEAPYRQAIGALLYLSIATRPDISYSVTTLSQYVNNYNQKHWEAVKHVMRYLQQTKDFGIFFSKSDRDLITGHCDADWAGDITDRKSLSGYLVAYRLRVDMLHLSF